MTLRWVFAAALSCTLVSPALADDFVSDLAACAKAPISASSFALTQSKKAAEFVINHGECVPMVVSGDPLLYGMTGGFAVLQGNGTLPSGTQACIDATLGQASQPIAQVLRDYVDAPPMASLIPAEGKTMLVQIAEGQTNAALYQVPGIGLVMDHVSCACAVSSSGLDINELKGQIKNVVGSVEGCKDLAKKLLGGAYSAAKGVYEAGKEFVNAVGCELGLGGCSDGPPFFCTGYFQLRDEGRSQSDIVKMFVGTWIADYAQSKSKKCEKKYQDAIVAKQKKAAEEAEAKLLAQEIEKAQKLGAANALGFAFRWIPKCYDQDCKHSISKIADLYTKDIQDPETLQNYKTFGNAIHVMEKKYGALATLAVAMSKKRRDKALMADPSAPVADRLDAFGCTPYLGLNRQSLCPMGQAYAVCAGYVRDGKWDACAREGRDGLYSADAALVRLVRQSGCIPNTTSRRRASAFDMPRTDLLNAQCLSGAARAACDFFVKGGSALACHGPEEVFVFNRARLRAPVRYQPSAPSRGLPSVFQPQTPVQPPPTSTLRNLRAITPQTGTVCLFDAGPRAGQRQDYPQARPVPVGTPCRDGRGSSGHVVRP